MLIIKKFKQTENTDMCKLQKKVQRHAEKIN